MPEQGAAVCLGGRPFHAYRVQLRGGKPPDWGIGVTVCVAVQAVFGEIVTVTDRMLTIGQGEFTAEGAANKSINLGKSWLALVAGRDVTSAPGLLRRIRRALEASPSETVDFVRSSLEEAYQAERRAVAAAEVLSPYGLTLEQFLENGQAQFGEAGAAVIRQRLEQRDLGCQLLVCGHDPHEPDPERSCHILSVNDPGVVADYDIPGYWAIGSGEYQALSALAHRHRFYRHLLPNAIYFACEAKFAAESALGVGRETWVTIRAPDGGMAFLSEKIVHDMRSEWERVGKPRKPVRALQILEKWAKKAEWT